MQAKEQQLTLKKKEEIIRAVFKEYRYAMETLEKLSQENLFPKIHYDGYIHETSASYTSYEQQLIKRIHQSESCSQLVELVNHVIEKLTPREKQIILYEYVEKADQNWWQSIYSRSSYYRLKNQALDHMLEYLMLY